MESSNEITVEEIHYSVSIELGGFSLPNDAVEAVIAKAKELGVQLDNNSFSVTVDNKDTSALAIGKKVYVAGFTESKTPNGGILFPKIIADKLNEACGSPFDLPEKNEDGGPLFPTPRLPGEKGYSTSTEEQLKLFEESDGARQISWDELEDKMYRIIEEMEGKEYDE